MQLGIYPGARSSWTTCAGCSATLSGIDPSRLLAHGYRCYDASSACMPLVSAMFCPVMLSLNLLGH